jgi:hypothetical protein
MTTTTPIYKRFTTSWLAGVAVVALLLSMGAFVAVFLTGRGAQEQAASIASDTAPAVLTLDVLCKRDDDLGRQLRQAAPEACGEQVDKAKAAVDGQPQPAVAAPGLSRQDVTAIVSAQLAGKVVTVDQVMAMVVSVYNSNRPADGKQGPGPTSDQVLAAVQAVCAGDKCTGPKGENAPPATAAEIFAQVAAYCSGEKAPCKGDTGATGATGGQGAQGVSIQEQAFVRNDQGACVSRVRYVNPATDQATTTDAPAGDAACPPVVPPTP